jgi:hypothetical protein
MWRINGGSKGNARNLAYGWLDDQLGMPLPDRHLGGRSYEQCLKATLLCRDLQAQLDAEHGSQDSLL